MAFLRYTSKAELSGGGVSGMPVILSDRSQVNWLSLNYMLDLFAQGVFITSIHTYAQHICDFISQLESEPNMELDQVHDGWVIAYKASIVDRGNSENYASQVLRTCLAFLKWLEDEGYFTSLIGEGSFNQVRIKVLESGLIKHAATKTAHKNERKTITPRIEWIDAVRPYGPQREDLSSRFNLMIDWGAQLGLRAKEICAIKVDQLPTLESAQKALREERNLNIKLTVTKGGKSEVIPVSPLLIKKTWEYIYSDRLVVAENCERRMKKRRAVYRDSGYVFLSDKTGSKFSPVSLSNAVRKAFLAAIDAGDLTIDERVWLHGLRHNFTVNLLKGLDSEGAVRPEAIARQVTRHGSAEAMEPYLTDRFNEDFDG